MIDRQCALPVTHQAKLLKVSRGSVYYLPKPVSEADLALMRRMGIEALAPQPGTSKADPGNKIYPYLLRKLDINRAKQVYENLLPKLAEVA
jgi:putative transposase